MPNNQGSNGPRAGMGSGRSRNTLVNLAGKKSNSAMPGGFIPAVSPGSALGYGAQTAQARYDYLAQLAALRAQRGMVVGNFQQARAGLKEQRLSDVSDAANAAAERGIVGSSVDMAGRASAHTTFAEGLATARSDRAQSLLSLAQQRLGVNSGYFRSLADIAAARRAEQAEMTAQMFQQDQYDAVQQNYGQVFRQLLSQIQDQKSGRIVRKRVGLGGTTPPPPATSGGYGSQQQTRY